MDIKACGITCKRCLIFKFQPIITEKQKAILKAMEAVEKGALISAATRQYGIPRSTLFISSSFSKPDCIQM